MEERFIEDDPILGRFIANYPINRLRLLIPAGAVLIAVWFIITIALWEVEDNLASTITVVVIFFASLVVGWLVLHLWNREIILYERGFTYREGSNIAYIRYPEIRATRQQGEVLSYFGGLIRRSSYQFTVETSNDEIFTLTNLYSHLDQLTLRLEQAITPSLITHSNTRLASGEKVVFNPTLAISADGLHNESQLLGWDSFGGYEIKNGELRLKNAAGEFWHGVSLRDIENIRVLIALLDERIPTS